jgi:hypothetical protein
MLLAALTLLDTCFAFRKALERSKLDGHDSHDIELYIEQRLHFIHAKIDLRPTISGLITLNKFSTKLEGRMPDSLGATLSRNLLRRLDRIVRKLMRVSSNVPTIRDKRSGTVCCQRGKRAIEFLGNLISDIFGNPGPADWKQSNANFLALQSALKKLNDNTFTDHHTIDTNTHIIEKHNKELRELCSAINRNQNELLTLNYSMNDVKIFYEISTLADTLESQVDSLVEIKLDSLKGFCSDRALDKDFLVSNLQSLEANRAGLGPVFGSWEWREFYKHDMCSAAVDKDILWVTMRIPLVKKAEKLVRVIPDPLIQDLLAKVATFSLQTELFREKTNDKFHVMTRSALDLCNNLGKVKTCGVRDARFRMSSEMVIPVEFNVNKFLLVGMNHTLVNVMEKCPNGITEHKIVTDSVLMVPNNCSYVSSCLTISTRESDVEIMKEVGILQFESFVANVVENVRKNSTQVSIESIAVHTSKKVFEQNRQEIDALLSQIDTKHQTLSSTYEFEKWIMVGSLILLVVILVAVQACNFWKRCRKPSAANDVEASKQVQIIVQQPRPDTDDKNDLRHTNDNHDKPSKCIDDELGAEHDYQEMILPGSNVNLGARPERSQFYKK